MPAISNDGRNIQLEGTVLLQLQEEAALQDKSLDQLASEAVLAGLQFQRLVRVEAIMSKGKQHGLTSGIVEDQIVDLIKADRFELS